MLNTLLLPLFDDIPKRIGQLLYSTEQLLLRLVVLSQVWEFEWELVEAIHKLVHLLLAIAGSLQELDEGSLTLVQVVNGWISLNSNFVHGEEPLSQIGALHVLPNFDLNFAGVFSLLLLLAALEGELWLGESVAVKWSLGGNIVWNIFWNSLTDLTIFWLFILKSRFLVTDLLLWIYFLKSTAVFSFSFLGFLL